MVSGTPARSWSFAAFAILLLVAARASASGPVELISRVGSIPPPEVLGTSQDSSISADGRYVAFTSTSPNLVPGQSDSNESGDIFLRDRLTGTVTLVSHNATSSTRTGNEGSSEPKISADGNWVAFSSTASDLVPGQIDISGFPGTLDAFLWQRSTGVITLVSRAASSPVTAGNGSSTTSMGLDLSADGAWVTFQRDATNLVAGQVDANGTTDVFLFDRAAGTTALVSHASGSPAITGSGAASDARISADGNYVVFASYSTNLIPGQSDSNGTIDVFLYSRAAGTSVLVSHASGSATTTANGFSSAPVINSDGRWIAYGSGADDLVAGQVSSFLTNVFLYDRTAGTSALLSGANGSATTGGNDSSSSPSISADGAYVAFQSFSTNLTAGQTDSNGAGDIFLFDRGGGTLRLVSGASGSATATSNGHSMLPVISSDGGRIVFESYATDLVSGQSDGNGDRDVFLYTRTSASLALVSHGAAPATTGNGFSARAVLDGGGGHVAFASVATDLTGLSDTNGGSDVFLYTAADASLSALSFSPPVSSVSPDFGSVVMSLSGDGRFAAFGSLQNVFLRDRAMGTTTLVSHTFSSATTPANNSSYNLSLSGDGAYAAFESWADDLVSGTDPSPPFGDPDVFLFDRATGTNTLVSHAPGVPNQGEGSSQEAKISADGSSVVFANAGGNLVSGLTDANSDFDIFLYSRATGENLLVSRSSSSSTTTGDYSSQKPALSADGGFVAFFSFASNLVTGQIQNNSDLNVFLFDRAAETTALVSHAASAMTATGNAGVTSFFAIPVVAPAISADGAYVAFSSFATDHVPGQIDANSATDVFLWERATGAITLVSRASASAVTSGNGFSDSPSISADGRYIAFASRATDLVPGQTDTNGKDDVFLYDRVSGTMALVSHAPGSATTTGAGRSWSPFVSPDGSAIVYNSDAANLEGGQVDNGSTSDVFRYDRLSGTNRLLSHAVGSFQLAGNADSSVVQISADGGTVAFNSEATDLVAGDYNDSMDAFVHDGRGLDFHTLTPCRLLDTRTPEGGPALVSGVTEIFVLAGACGVPANARALALNITVTQGSGGGHLTVFPGDFPLAPNTSTINFQAGQTRANNAVLALSGDGSLAVTPVVSGGGTVHVILDVTGYFVAGTD